MSQLTNDEYNHALEVLDLVEPVLQRAITIGIAIALRENNEQADEMAKRANGNLEPFQLKPHPDFVDQMIWQGAYNAAVSGAGILNAKIYADQALQEFRERFPK